MSQVKRITTVAAAALVTVVMTLSVQIAFSTSEAHAATPGTVFVEGYMHTTGVGPVSDGNYVVTFALYGGKSAVKAMWAEGPVTISVKGGRWAYALGAKTPINAAAIAGASTLWLGLKVASDPELPRVRVHSAFYAQAAGVAGGISCTGCVSVKALKADAPLDLGGQTVKAKLFIGDGSQLTGITVPAGKCPSGQVVSGINKDGSLICGSASPLPDDGVDKVSQGLIAVVGDLYAGNVPVDINDNNPKGSESKITLNNVGKVDKLTVAVGLKITSGNSGIDKLRICLIGPGGTVPNNLGFDAKYCTGKHTYLLHDKTGAGKTLLQVWPSPSKEVKGNIAEWIGTDPSGVWIVQVVDTNFDTNKAIGVIDKFVISARTTGNNKINVGKELVVDGEAKFNNGLVIGSSTKKCAAATKGLTRYNGTANRMQWCDGTSWRYFGQGAAQYRWARLTTYSNSGWSWAYGNDANSYGGVAPGTWTDGNGIASQMSSDTQKLLTLFNKKGYGGYNANVWVNTFIMHSSTLGEVVWALFRVKNTTKSNITWKVNWTCTGYTGWGEKCSAALNGSNIWNGNCGSGICNRADSLTIPANRTSTAIFVSTSSQPCCNHNNNHTRGVLLRFYNDSLKLPTGLEFVDDLETKANGWNN